jgi:hypothetical protein
VSEASLPRRRSALPWLVALLVALALGSVVTIALRGKDANPSQVVQRVGQEWKPLAGEFAGAESCRECHQDIFDRQMKTAHADSVRSLADHPPRSPFGSGQAVVDPDTGAQYEMTTKDGRPNLSIKAGANEAQQEVHFEFGSGKRAFAYLADLGDNQFLDSRLNYYKSIGKWDFTSGQEVSAPSLIQQPLGRVLSSDDAAMCFGCHSTALHVRGMGKDGTATSPSVTVDVGKTMLGVTCERCHGPRQQHVRDFKMGKRSPRAEPFTAESQNKLCGECHSVPDATSGHKAAARFQPFGLGRSECFLKSEGKLSCSSCHDPHEDAKRDEAYYVSRCLECHSKQEEPHSFKLRVCSVNPRSGCVSCHLARDSKSMLHTTFVDHYIRILKATEQNKPSTGSGNAKGGKTAALTTPSSGSTAR